MGLDLEHRLRPQAGATLYLGYAYAQQLQAAGALVFPLLPHADPLPLLEDLDGLLIPGGDDLEPLSHYPESVRFTLEPAEKVAFDRGLLAGALARRLPILGVCYGMQLLALELGGRLHYDLATDLPAGAPHQLARGECHGLLWEPGPSALAGLLDRVAQVNSRHHQGVADVGPELRVAARSPDGVIEAIEAPDRAFCVGVQWHPEDTAGPQGRRLFEGFVAAAGSRRTTVAPQPPR